MLSITKDPRYLLFMEQRVKLGDSFLQVKDLDHNRYEEMSLTYPLRQE